jgi:hypothetical protein
MANIMRFVILGDDRGGPAFAQFAKQVERANKSVDRNSAALKRQGASAKQAEGGVLSLVGAVTGFGDAAGAASSRGSMFSRVLAGLNLATGVLEPALAGVAVAAGSLAAAAAAGGAALGAFSVVARAAWSASAGAATKAQAAQTAYAGAVSAANAKYSQAMDKATTKAQRQAAATARQNALASAQASKVRALTVAYDGLTPAQVQLSKSIGAMQDRWQKFTASFAPMLNRIVGKIQPVFGTVLGYIGKLATAGGTAIEALLPQLTTALNSSGFRGFIDMLAKNAGPVIVRLGVALGHVAVGIGGILRAFMPVNQMMLPALDKITARFATWGQTLTSHTGFQSLMTMFREETPLAVQVLKNLSVVLGNVGRAMTGIASPANSKALLQALIPISQLLANLSRNQSLVRLALYLYAVKSAANQVRPAILGVSTAITGIKTGVTTAKNTVQWFGRLRDGFVSSAAAASAFSGTAGTIGGKLRSAVTAVGAAVVAVKGWTIWSRIAAVATAAWGLAMRALPFVAIATAVAALVYLVIKYHRQIWAFAVRAWHAIWDTITSVVSSVLGWLRGHWPLIVSILGGPVGAVAVLVIRHWNQIRNGAVTAFNTVIGFFRGIPGRILGALGKIGSLLYNKGKDVIQGFWNGLTAVWRSVTGWISGIASWIKAHKGPVSLDASLLYPAGHALMSGFLSGLKAGFGPVGSFVGGIASWVLGKIKGAGGKLLGGKIVLDTSQFSAAALSGAVGGDAAANRALARRIFPWPASMWPAFDYLEMREAGYNRFARNPSSGAYGIPQALPPTKMPFAAQAAGGSHAGAQLSWMFAYIRSVYGNPVNAAAHERAFNWYASGTRSAARGWAWVGERGPELVRFRGGEQVGPVYAGNGAGSGGNTYQITVNVPPTASKADVGRTVVEAIRAYEKGSGSGWRK